MGGIEAAKRGLDAIMTPTTYYYLDFYQKPDNRMILIGNMLPVETTYSYNPVPDDAAPELKKHVKGVQANLWTEYIIGRDLAFFQLLHVLLQCQRRLGRRITRRTLLLSRPVKPA